MPKIVKRPDRDSYYAWITDPETGRKKRRSLKASNLRTASVIAEGLERAAFAPDHARTCTLEAACQSFIAHHCPQKAEGTRHMYGVKIGTLLRILGPQTSLAKIDAQEIDRLIAVLLGEGKEKSTIGKTLTALRGVLKMARRHKLYPHALDEVMPAWSGASEPKERWCTSEETWSIIGLLPPRRGAAVAFHVATGSNYAECMRAQPEDIVPGDEFLTADVFLRGTKRQTRRRKSPVYVWGMPFLAYAVQHGGTTRGKPMFDDWPGMRWDLKLRCDKLKIPSVSSNDLRSSYGMWLRLRGVSPTLIGTAMGHADGRMAERRYAKVPVDKLRVLIDLELGGQKST